MYKGISLKIAGGCNLYDCPDIAVVNISCLKYPLTLRITHYFGVDIKNVRPTVNSVKLYIFLDKYLTI